MASVFLPIGLVLIGAGQLYVASRQTKILGAQSTISSQQLSTQQEGSRAFVFLTEADFFISQDGYNIVFRPEWKNSGTTPTRDLLIQSNGGDFLTETGPGFFLGAPMPPNFDFPMTDPKLETGIALHNVLGPMATTYAEGTGVSTDKIAAINDGQLPYYVWGLAEYEDVFSDKKHITRFCIQVANIPLKPPGLYDPLKVEWAPCVQGNCADDECTAEGLGPPN